MRKSTCQRRVNGIKCDKDAVGHCSEHFKDKCTQCGERPATYECTWNECKKPLCTTCQCHNSFGK